MKPFDIIGNSQAKSAVSSMFGSGRLPHSFLLFGEKGLGKKVFADHLAAALLCERHEGEPCGECRSCRLAADRHHPDIIYPEQSGKLCTYSVETCRKVCADAFTAPNDTDAKVYIFADCDGIRQPAQNALLKIVEEPPDHVYFIFTASMREVFLPTILSRVTCIGLSPVTEDECRAALAREGFEDGQIRDAVSAFGGNIGMCREFISGEALQNVTALTKRAADSIISSDEYGLLTVLSSPLLKDRDAAAAFLEALDKVIMDCVTVRFGGSGISCYQSGAQKLSERISVRASERIHERIVCAAADIRANVNRELVMTALCGEIFG